MIIDAILVFCCLGLGTLVGIHWNLKHDILAKRVDYLEQKIGLLEEATKKNGEFMIKQNNELESIAKDLTAFFEECKKLKERI